MSVLFVCSGNRGISPIVIAQAESLRAYGLHIDIVPVQGNGIFGYLAFIPKLAKHIKRLNPDIIHAHYSLCGFIATLATSKSVVTSLMGSDVNQSGFWRFMIRFFVQHCWKTTIVKSNDMKLKLGLTTLAVIPNGVDLTVFKPMDKNECRSKLGWNLNKTIILFAADPDRNEKNYPLAQQAVEMCVIDDLEMRVVFGKSQAEIPYYLNAADLLLLTSKWEGSPNIVKEAMACNLPVVSTNVGDVEYLFQNTNRNVCTEPQSDLLCLKIKEVLESDLPCNGRDRIIDNGLDSNSIAERIKSIYMLCIG